MLKDYWDLQLIDLLLNGFPLDFNKNTSLHCDNKSNASAVEHPDDVTEYHSEEIEHKAIVKNSNGIWAFLNF